MLACSLLSSLCAKLSNLSIYLALYLMARYEGDINLIELAISPYLYVAGW